MSKRRKPRRLEKPHRFINPKDTAAPRPDGYEGRAGWVLRDLRPTGGASYWASTCAVVGCERKTIAPVCGICGGWGEDATIPVEWRIWYKEKPTVKRMKKMLAACFDEGAYEVM